MPSEYRFHRVLSEHWGSLSGGKLTSSRKGEAERGRKKNQFLIHFWSVGFQQAEGASVFRGHFVHKSTT